MRRYHIVGGHLVGFWPSWDSLPGGHEVQKPLVLVSLSTRRWNCRWPEGKGFGRALGYWLPADARHSKGEVPLPEIEAFEWCQKRALVLEPRSVDKIPEVKTILESVGGQNGFDGRGSETMTCTTP